MAISWRFMQVVWPAFLGACALELLVFAVVDPRELHLEHLALSRMATYTVAFFLFWLVVTLACALTVLLSLQQPQPPLLHDEGDGPPP